MTFGVQVVGRTWDWQRQRPSQDDARLSDMTREQKRHWRRMARYDAATTPADRLHAAWQIVAAVADGHPDAQEYLAETLVTLATATAVARRGPGHGARRWVFADALGAGVDVPTQVSE